MSDVLATKPRLLRSPVARGLDGDDAVDRDGGDFGAGLIKGFAVITRGEALGHGLWLDADFIQQVATAMGRKRAGLKTRFTHPSLSGDGLGKMLGRAKGGELDGDTVRGDLHFTSASHKSPDGDLAGYVMDLAAEDPEAFGASIVYEPDVEAEEKFIEAHGGELVIDDYGFATVQDFESPDPDNKQNLPHARLKALLAVDVVDDPAANPTGMFYRGQEIATEADALLAFSLGLSKQRPALTRFDIDPNRASGFVSRFLSSRGLRVVKESDMKNLNAGTAEQPAAPVEQPAVVAPADAATAEQTPAVAVETVAEETKPEDESQEAVGAGAAATPQLSAAQQCKRYIEAFGAKGGEWFADGKTFEQASALHVQQLSAENKQLREQLKNGDRGEPSPVSFGVQPTDAEERLSKLTVQLGSPALAQFAAGITFKGRK